MSEREVIMDPRRMPFNENGTVGRPLCCGEKMQDDGGCSVGCCDDYKCSKCGRRIRIEWPD